MEGQESLCNVGTRPSASRPRLLFALFLVVATLSFAFNLFRLAPADRFLFYVDSDNLVLGSVMKAQTDGDYVQ